MTRASKAQVTAIADYFVAWCRKGTPDGAWERIRADNAARCGHRVGESDHEGVCATHDHFDANDGMEEALAENGFLYPEPDNRRKWAPYETLWGRAWGRAMQRGLCGKCDETI